MGDECGRPRGLPRGSSHFRELTRSECEALLQKHVVGRVGFCGAAGPLILPVNYRVHAGQVVFRTSAYGMLSATDTGGIRDRRHRRACTDRLGRARPRHRRSSRARPSPHRAVGQWSDPMDQRDPQHVHRHHLDLAYRPGHSRALRRLTDLAPNRACQCSHVEGSYAPCVTPLPPADIHAKPTTAHDCCPYRPVVSGRGNRRRHTTSAMPATVGDISSPSGNRTSTLPPMIRTDHFSSELRPATRF